MSIRPECSFDNIYSPMHLSDVRPITANENQKQEKVSDVAEEVSPQSPATKPRRRIMEWIDGRDTQGSINGDRTLMWFGEK